MSFCGGFSWAFQQISFSFAPLVAFLPPPPWTRGKIMETMFFLSRFSWGSGNLIWWTWAKLHQVLYLTRNFTLVFGHAMNAMRHHSKQTHFFQYLCNTCQKYTAYSTCITTLCLATPTSPTPLCPVLLPLTLPCLQLQLSLLLLSHSRSSVSNHHALPHLWPQKHIAVDSLLVSFSTSTGTKTRHPTNASNLSLSDWNKIGKTNMLTMPLCDRLLSPALIGRFLAPHQRLNTGFHVDGLSHGHWNQKHLLPQHCLVF